MSELKLNGKLVNIFTVQSGTSKSGIDWKSQNFLVEVDGKFPKQVCFTLFGDKIDLLKDIKTGSEVEVYFNLESRQYKEAFFHNVNAWRIDVVGQSNGSSSSSVKMPLSPETTDDLPF